VTDIPDKPQAVPVRNTGQSRRSHSFVSNTGILQLSGLMDQLLWSLEVFFCLQFGLATQLQTRTLPLFTYHF
jgi:hypothetical protein